MYVAFFNLSSIFQSAFRRAIDFFASTQKYATAIFIEFFLVTPETPSSESNTIIKNEGHDLAVSYTDREEQTVTSLEYDEVNETNDFIEPEEVIALCTTFKISELKSSGLSELGHGIYFDKHEGDHVTTVDNTELDDIDTEAALQQESESEWDSKSGDEDDVNSDFEDLTLFNKNEQNDIWHVNDADEEYSGDADNDADHMCIVSDKRDNEYDPVSLFDYAQDVAAYELDREHTCEVSEKKVAFSDLEVVRTIGMGSFGRVMLVRHRQTNQGFALKCMQKSKIVDSHQVKNIFREKEMLRLCDHPFVVKLIETYTGLHHIFMLFELVQGGDLWALLYRNPVMNSNGIYGVFDLPVARFYVANVVESLRYLDSIDVAYRDLKLENLVVDSTGFLKMVDFGFAKRVRCTHNRQRYERSFTMCGTTEYMAPEVVLKIGHGKAVDHWALGCLIYELLAGETPFFDPDQRQMIDKIVSGRTTIKFPSNFDEDAADLVFKLLHPNPACRLGSLAGGMDDVVNHPFFATFDWKSLRQKTMQPPYVPAIAGMCDADHFDVYTEATDICPFAADADPFEGF